MNQLFALIVTGAFTSVYLITKSKNPVHSVFYLILAFLHCSRLLVLAGLEYFVLLQLLVYIGALAILFLFVVMLLDIPSTEILAHQRGTYPVVRILVLCILLSTYFSLWSHLFNTRPAVLENELRRERKPFFSQSRNSFHFWQRTREKTSPVAALGVALYGVHPDLLILRSLVLLVAIVGAVGLTLKRPIAAPDYDVFRQHYRDFQKRLVFTSQKNK